MLCMIISSATRFRPPSKTMMSANFRLAGAWSVMITYIAPVCIVIILIAYVAQTMGIITL